MRRVRSASGVSGLYTGWRATGLLSFDRKGGIWSGWDGVGTAAVGADIDYAA